MSGVGGSVMKFPGMHVCSKKTMQRDVFQRVKMGLETPQRGCFLWKIGITINYEVLCCR